MSITPADVPQPTSLIKQARISTAAHDINAFFKKVKGEKTVCVRCQCVSFSFSFRSSHSTQQYFSLLEQNVWPILLSIESYVTISLRIPVIPTSVSTLRITMQMNTKSFALRMAGRISYPSTRHVRS